MKTIAKKLALLSLLAVALFVPQQSHAVRSIRWDRVALVAGGIVGTGWLAYKAYSYFTTPSEEKNISFNKEDDENDEWNFSPNDSAIYAGSLCTKINEQYGITNSKEAILFTTVCAIFKKNNGEKLYIPIELLKKNCDAWSQYFLQNTTEPLEKIVAISSYKIDLSHIRTNTIRQYLCKLEQNQFDYRLSDRENLIKEGILKVTIENDEICEIQKQQKTDNTWFTTDKYGGKIELNEEEQKLMNEKHLNNKIETLKKSNLEILK